MKKYWILSLLLIFMSLFETSQAKRKSIRKKPTQNVWLELKDASYTKPTKGIIGNTGLAYTFTVKTLAKNILIDSVWFGEKPVPCDLYQDVNDFKIEKTKEPGLYFVKANKYYYEILQERQSTKTNTKSYKAPFPFKGEAFIMYRLNGKRYYAPVNQVTYFESVIKQ